MQNSFLVLKNVVDEQSKILENQKLLIETLSNDLYQTHLKLDTIEFELAELKKNFDANDFDPCVRTCSQSLEGKTQWEEFYVIFFVLTLRRPNLLGAHVPVAPDLAKTVKVGSDHSENLTSVPYSTKNE